MLEYPEDNPFLLSYRLFGNCLFSRRSMESMVPLPRWDRGSHALCAAGFTALSSLVSLCDFHICSRNLIRRWRGALANQSPKTSKNSLSEANGRRPGVLRFGSGYSSIHRMTSSRLPASRFTLHSFFRAASLGMALPRTVSAVRSE
jgi:hypothetical protein